MPLTSDIGTGNSLPARFQVLGPLTFVVPSTIELDVFQTDPGVDAGRIEPRAIAPASGSYVFCLGHDEPSYFGFLQPGGYDQISQTDAFPSGNVITFQAVTRAPLVAPPNGAYWQADVLLDGTSVGSRILALKGPIAWEWAVDASGLSGSHALAFRLTFVSPALPTPPPSTNLPVIEVEIPAFYVDAIAFSTVVGPLITNEVPVAFQGEVAAVGAPPPDTTNIDFDVFGLGSNVIATDIQVTINTVPAIVNGIVQTGFHGTVGSSAEILHVTIAPNLAFGSASIVTVAVSATNASSVTHSRTWTFEVADTSPPVMATVQAIGTNQLRVTWNKTVLLSDPAAAHDGLNPGLYYLSAIQPDTVTPAVSGGPVGPTIYTPAPYLVVSSAAVVAAAGPSVVDLFTNEELTPGIVYDVTELGVEDLVGNFCTSVTATVAFVPPQPPGREWNLYRLLALMNRQEDVSQDLLRFANCLQEPNDLLLYAIDTWPEIFDVDAAPDPFLTAMLADLGNPFPFVLTTEQKRKLLHILVPIYQQKGTAIGIINAVRFFLGITITITTYDGSENWTLGESVLGEDPLPPRGYLASIVSKVGSVVTIEGFSELDLFRTVGREITFSHAASGGNRGTFRISGVPAPDRITITNPLAVVADANNGTIAWVMSEDPDATGTALLGPGTLFALYSFTVNLPGPLTAEQVQQITFIANYMKPAHTHLVGVLVPVIPPAYDPVELGISELGVDWVLHNEDREGYVAVAHVGTATVTV